VGVVTIKSQAKLRFLVYVKVGNSLKQEHILSLASKRKISARKKIEKVWHK
jgi:hypothetical protein